MASCSSRVLLLAKSKASAATAPSPVSSAPLQPNQHFAAAQRRLFIKRAQRTQSSNSVDSKSPSPAATPILRAQSNSALFRKHSGQQKTPPSFSPPVTSGSRHKVRDQQQQHQRQRDSPSQSQSCAPLSPLSSPLVAKRKASGLLKMIVQRRETSPMMVGEPQQKVVDVIPEKENSPNGQHQTGAAQKSPKELSARKVGKPSKKWTSALRVVSAMTRFRNMPKRKSSEGPLPWALREEQQLRPQQPYLLGAQPPPVRRASLQHQWDNGGGEMAAELRGTTAQIFAGQPFQAANNYSASAAAIWPQIGQKPQRNLGQQLPQHRRSQPSLLHHAAEQQQFLPQRNVDDIKVDEYADNERKQYYPSEFGMGTIGRRKQSHPTLISLSQVAAQHTARQNSSGGGYGTPPRGNGTPPRGNGTPPRGDGTPPRTGGRRLPAQPPHGLFMVGQQHSLQSPGDSPKQQRRFHPGQQQQTGVRTPPTPVGQGGTRSHHNSPSASRKASMGAVYGSAFVPNENYPVHYTPPHYAHTNDGAPAFLFSSAAGARAHAAANSPSICRASGGGVERRILRRCPQSDLANRFQRHHHDGSSRGSSFSGSNESTPTRTTADTEHVEIDPTYLALKQASAKYGVSSANGAAAGSRGGSRRGSHTANGAVAMAFDSATPSPRNLSQTSLQDSGMYSGGELCGSRSKLVSGSTPQLHGGHPLANGSVQQQSHSSGAANDPSAGVPPLHHSQHHPGPKLSQCCPPTQQRRPKLAEKMKSLSLDCAEMPPPVQNGMMRPAQQYKNKQIHSARGHSGSGDSFDYGRSVSPPNRGSTAHLGSNGDFASPRPQQQRRALPPTPQKQAPFAQQIQNMVPAAAAAVPLLHIVSHEYACAECTLRPGDRMVVVDNGDADWTHGFRLGDRLEQLLTFPASCVAAFQPDEQPMRLKQSCNLVEQKLRLYRDQVVFVQPNSLSEDGRVLIRNEHDKFAHCPLQYLTLI